jgi:hypothetical protein
VEFERHVMVRFINMYFVGNVNSSLVIPSLGKYFRCLVVTNVITMAFNIDSKEDIPGNGAFVGYNIIVECAMVAVTIKSYGTTSDIIITIMVDMVTTITKWHTNYGHNIKIIIVQATSLSKWYNQ